MSSGLTESQVSSKPRPTEEWKCSLCNYINNPNFDVCVACETPISLASYNNGNSFGSSNTNEKTDKDTSTSAVTVEKKNGPEMKEPNNMEKQEVSTRYHSTSQDVTNSGSTMWECIICTLKNDDNSSECMACDFPRGSSCAPKKKLTEEKVLQTSKSNLTSISKAQSYANKISLNITCGEQLFKACDYNFLQQHDMDHFCPCGIIFRDQQHAKAHLLHKSFPSVHLKPIPRSPQRPSSQQSSLQQRRKQKQQQRQQQRVTKHKPAPRTSRKSAFVFACTSDTYKECIDLMLFGGTKTLQKDRSRGAKDIQYGTPLFLLNIKNNTVFGPFFAESMMIYNHDPSAWGFNMERGEKVSKYPCQVCVDMSEWEAAKSPCVSFRRTDPICQILKDTKGGNWINERAHRSLVQRLKVEFPDFD
jgi:hypothetical protein